MHCTRLREAWTYGRESCGRAACGSALGQLGVLLWETVSPLSRVIKGLRSALILSPPLCRGSDITDAVTAQQDHGQHQSGKSRRSPCCLSLREAFCQHRVSGRLQESSALLCNPAGKVHGPAGKLSTSFHNPPGPLSTRMCAWV